LSAEATPPLERSSQGLLRRVFRVVSMAREPVRDPIGEWEELHIGGAELILVPSHALVLSVLNDRPQVIVEN
jgi:hypothetical protein